MKLVLLSSLFVTLLSPRAALRPEVPFRGAAARAAPCGAPAETTSATPANPLRPRRRWIRDLIHRMRPKSATLDHLIRAAESSGAVIYVDEAHVGDWGGRTILAGAPYGYTYLRIELHRLRPDVTAALLAHELQHALEITSSGVTTAQEVADLYRRIGMEWRGHHEQRFDSAAAIRAGRATLLELR